MVPEGGKARTRIPGNERGERPVPGFRAMKGGGTRTRIPGAGKGRAGLPGRGRPIPKVQTKKVIPWNFRS